MALSDARASALGARELLHSTALDFWHVSCMCEGMPYDPKEVSVRMLMRRSGVSFTTRRVLQRWLRGEITVDTAVELIQTDDVTRLIGAWTTIRR